jgi:glycosyltransferase involved in cell wall biosynthesis
MGGAPLLGTLISALIDRGHTVSAYTLDHDLPLSIAGPLVIEGTRGFRIFYGPYRRHSFRFNGRWPGRAIDAFRLERRFLEDSIAIDQPDVVHAHWAYEFSLAAIACGRPHVITCHDSPRQVLRLMPNLYRLCRYYIARKVLGSARIVTAVSPYLQKELARDSAVEVRVVANPGPHEAFREAVARQAWTGREPRIASILNGWSKIKNPEVALGAFFQLRQTYPNASLHLFGYDFGPGEKAESWARARNLEQGVIFHGAMPHSRLLEELRGVDILLHTALEEACPLALIEAMAMGLPVVGGDNSGGVPWVLGNGAAGILADVRYPDAVCNAMLRLIEDRALYERISRTAIARGYSVFRPEVIAEQYERLYLEAIGSTNGTNLAQAA